MEKPKVYRYGFGINTLIDFSNSCAISIHLDLHEKTKLTGLKKFIHVRGRSKTADYTFGLFLTLPPYPDPNLTFCIRPSLPTLTRQGVILTILVTSPLTNVP